MKLVWLPIVCTCAIAAADPEPAAPPEACAGLVNSFALAPDAAIELAIGDCYTRAAQLEQAARWYRDAARRALLAASPPLDLVPLPAAPPPAVDRLGWKIAAWTSVGVTALGLASYVYGRHQIDDAEAKLCAGGGYGYDMPGCTPNGAALSYAQVEQLNDQGERGKTIAGIGIAAGLVGGAAAGLALYEAYFSRDARRERVVISPVVAPGTGGAQLRVQW